MNEVIKKEALFLHYFAKASDKDKRIITRSLTKSQIQAISGIIYNAIKNRFEIKTSDLDELRKYRSSLYLVANKTTPLKRKASLIARRLKQVSVILTSALKWIPAK